MARVEVVLWGRRHQSGLAMANIDPAKKPGLTRREWLRLGVAASAGVAAGALGATAISRLLGPPATVEGEVRDTIVYASSPWGVPREPLTPIRVTDLQEWEGTTGLWRGVFVTAAGRSYLTGSGFLVWVIRVRRDDANFSSPRPASFGLPPGVDFFYDDPARDIRIVVFFIRCTHTCCIATWHISTPLTRDYVARSPTFEVYGQDPIYCICHDTQWEPMVLVTDRHPNRTSYVGAQVLRGPALRALPVVPVRAEDDVLFGALIDPLWYTSYCE